MAAGRGGRSRDYGRHRGRRRPRQSGAVTTPRALEAPPLSAPHAGSERLGSGVRFSNASRAGLPPARGNETRRLAIAACLLIAAGPAAAQDADPAEAARFRFGPFRFTPAIAVTNVGIDDNVFNDPVDPKGDTTAAIGPAIDVWTKVGRARVTAKSSGQYLYFKTYDNQRSWNTSNDVQVELPLVRFKPFVGGTYLDTRERPGYEIDSRARRRDMGVRAGGEWRLSRKTRLAVRLDALQLEFDDDETFLGANLANALNRSSHTEQLQVKASLTPLTTLVVSADAIQDRFAINSLRDADSIRVMSGFELKPFALISGTVFVGVRHFNALDASVPDFNGVVASVDAKYAVRATQFTLKVARDITYSFEIEQPYYTLTDTTVGVTQRVTAVWDVVGRVGRQSLGYRNLETAQGLAPRTDHAVLYGGGLGYRFGETLRFGIDVNNYRRTAPAAELRSYSGLRAGASVSYGFPQ